ncbi:uracil-DNA glycosylase [Hahella sp. CCB-MM4]|uniref:uracil-DNA glycosylase n=1 Tax=Hahella sp. (strain CCB-MM4) TaxID=1926491 RepID=UPI000B9ADE7F|nr:uracil-DNA glycosylase [Hahella sp. CCB-MM4]OZG70629.1 uracil-DNA glycosylase [Hahella sp. CCB-MM4]
MSFLQNALKPGTGWDARLADQFSMPYMQQLEAFLSQEEAAGKVIYPSLENCFNALNSTAFDQVKVVILGQDPYHGPGQAHGLCFSVLPGVKPPPSLVNIFKEIHQDLGVSMPEHGCLGYWTQQGVLLLNSVLTVEQAQAASHQGRGWEKFTDRVIQLVNEERENVVFMLWGSYAQRKGAFIDRQKHLVLESVHPSPLSAHRGFMGCRHFSAANAYLKDHQEKAIDWRLPPKDMLDEHGLLDKTKKKEVV